MNNSTITTTTTEKILSDKSYFVNSLKDLKDRIESISLFHQTKILNIFYDNNIPINENKNGIHLNLSDFNDSILDELLVYINYVTKQETELNNIEKQKESYKNTYFLKDNKDNCVTNINNKYAT